jgi:glutathione peroxidase
MTTVYDFDATQIDGKSVQLSSYRGKVLLIVNTASKCGFTPQFEGLEKLHEKYAAQGLTVLGFPSNQFGSQDPGSNEEIGAFCTKNYGVSFPMMEKIDVNGSGAAPLYQWLSKEKPGLLHQVFVGARRQRVEALCAARHAGIDGARHREGAGYGLTNTAPAQGGASSRQIKSGSRPTSSHHPQ